MSVRVVTSRSNQPITVNALIDNPLIVPERTLQVLDNQFVADRVLRNAGTATGGAVAYRVSSGIFADASSEIVSPGGEIPVAQISRGDISSVPVQKRGLAVVVDREMRLRNAMGEVDRQIQVVKNTVVRDIDGAFITALRAALVSAGQTAAATNPWSGGTATIRKNINAARLGVSNGAVSTNNFTGFRADTLIISPTTEADLMNSTEFLALLFGSNMPSDLSGLDGRNVLGLRILVTPSVGDNDAFVVQSKAIGGYADEIPLESTELYYWAPNQIWRSDTVRSTAGFIDQPLAGYLLTAV